MKTHKVTTYSINELSDSAKEKALDNLRINWLDYDWHQDTIDECKTIGKMIGIDIDDIYFSGFSSQGDGACFVGSYKYKRGSLNTVKEHLFKDETLIEIVERLTDIQKRNFWCLSAVASHHGHYYHSHSVDIGVTGDHDYAMTNEADEVVSECLRDFMDWIYRRLESKYDHLMSDEYMIENCEINEREFTENGDLWI